MAHRVLIVEDDEQTRLRLSRAVQGQPFLEFDCAVGSLVEAKAALARSQPQILLTDLGLPDGSGIDLIRHACQREPSPNVLVISVFGDEEHVIDAIRAGASGYLLKDASDAEIGEALQDLISGGAPISPGVARYLLRQIRAPVTEQRTAPAPGLTNRERDILELVAKGYSYAEIGHALKISVNTVGSHIRQLYRKLSVSSRGEAVFEAAQIGLLDPPRRR